MNVKLKFKTCKQGRLYLMISVLIVTFIGLGIALVTSYYKDWMEDFLYFILIMAGIDLFCMIVLFCARISAKTIVVTENEIIEYKDKNIVFRIRKEQIEEVVIRRMSLKNRIIACVFSAHALAAPNEMGDELSLRFYNAEVEKERVVRLNKSPLINDGDGRKEFVESLSEKEILKICKQLNLEIGRKEVIYDRI